MLSFNEKFSSPASSLAVAMKLDHTDHESLLQQFADLCGYAETPTRAYIFDERAEFDKFGETMQGALHLVDGEFKWSTVPFNACWRYNYVLHAGGMFDALSLDIVRLLDQRPPLRALTYNAFKSGARLPWAYLYDDALREARKDIETKYKRGAMKLTKAQQQMVDEMNEHFKGGK